jgi:hypothetical protein
MVVRKQEGLSISRSLHQCRPSESPQPFITYSDADHGGNPDNGRSTGGYVVKIGTGAVSWSKLQTLVALSTTEVEHISAGGWKGDPMDVQVYGGAWLQCFWAFSALDGQLVCNCSE